MAQGKVKIGIEAQVNKASFNTAKSALRELQQIGATKMSLGNGIEQDLSRITQMAQQVEVALNEAFNVNLGTVNLNKFNQILSKSGISIKQLGTEAAKAGTQGQAAFQKMATQLLTTNVNIKKSHELLDKMAYTLGNTIRWSIASSAINAVTGSIQKAYRYTVDLDTSLNDIRIVTEKSADEMERFAVSANKAAKELGASTKSYADAALIYYQQGLSDEEVAARSSVTVKAANVTGQSAQTVSEQLTAVWNGYKVSAAESEKYIDKLAAVAASTAADLEELSVGMSRVASAANIMGVDVDQLNAQLATIVSVTREAPESIGTALKTVYARMSDLEAGTDAETTLGEYTKQMAQFGIQALDVNGKLRDMGSVVEEIGGKWEYLSRNQQVALAQTIAGTRQYSRMMALFDNWDMYEEALSTSQNSLGTLQKQQDIYMESTEAHLARLTAQSEELYSHLFDTDNVEELVELLIKLIDGVDNFVGSLGGGMGVLQLFGTLALNLFGTQLSRGIATTVKNMQTSLLISRQIKAEQALVNDGLSKEALLDQDIVNIKKEQLKYQKVLSTEEYASINQSLQGIDELTRKQQELRKAREQKQETLSTKALGQKFRDKDADSIVRNYEATMERKAQSRALGEVGVQQEETLKQLAAFDTAKAKVDALNQSLVGLNQEQQEAIVKSTAYKDAMTLMEDSATKADLSFEELTRETQELLNSLNPASETYKRLNDALQQAQAGGDKNVVTTANLASVYAKATDEFLKYGNTAYRTAQQIQQLDQEEREAAEAADRLKAKTKGIFDGVKLDHAINQFTTIAGKITSITMGVNMLSNLGSIWKNDDLSAGEKFAQTLMNIGMALPMILNGLTLLSPLLNKLAAQRQIQIELGIKEEAAEKAAQLRTVANRANNHKKIADLEKEALVKKIAAISTDELAAEEKELATAYLTNYETKKRANAQDQKDAFNKVQKILATEAETLATERDTFAEEHNTAATFKNIAAEKLSAIGKGFKAFGSGFKGAQAVGGKGAFAAGQAAVAGSSGAASVLGTIGSALGSIPVVGWAAAAAIAAVTAATILTVNARNKEKKALEAAREEQTRMNKALDEARTAYSEAKSTISSFKELAKTFEELTKNSTEWNEKLLENNNQVLDLIAKYPQLSEYMTRNGDGILTIAEAGLNSIEAQEAAALAKAQEAKILADQTTRNAAIAYNKEMLLRTTATADFLSVMSGLTNLSYLGSSDLFSAIAGNKEGSNLGFFTQIARGENPFKDNVTTDQLNTILDKIDLTTIRSSTALANALEEHAIKLEDSQLIEALYDNKAALINLQNEIAENNRLAAIEQATIYQSYLTSFGYNTEQATTLAGIVAAAQQDADYSLDGKSKDAWIKEEAARIRQKEGNNKELIRQWAAEKGIEYTKIKQTGGGNFKYQDADGNTIKVSYDRLAEDLATFRFNANVLTNSIGEYEDILNNVSEFFERSTIATGGLVEDIIAANAALEVDNLENYSIDTLKELDELIASDLWNELPSVTQNAIQETKTNIQESLANFSKDRGWSDAVASWIKNIGGSLDYAGQQFMAMDAQTASLYGEAAQSFYNTGGVTALESFKAFTSGLGDAADSFVKYVNWTSDTIEQDLIVAWEESGQVWDPTTEACYGMLSAVKELNGELITSRETFKAVADIIKDLNAQGDTIDKEAFNTLKELVPAVDNYFVQMLDGTYRLTSSAAEFKKVAEEAYKAQMASSLKDLEDEVKKFESSVANLISGKDIGGKAIEKQTGVVNEQARAALENNLRNNIANTGIKASSFNTMVQSNEDMGAVLAHYLMTEEGWDMGKKLATQTSEFWSSPDELKLRDYFTNPATQYSEEEIYEILKNITSDFRFVNTKNDNGNVGINWKDLKFTESWENINNAVVAKQMSEASEQYTDTAYSSESFSAWLQQLQANGLLSQEKVDEWVKKITDDPSLLFNVGGSDDLVQQVLNDIEGDASFDKSKAKELLLQSLQSGFSWDELTKMVPEAISLLTDAEQQEIQNTAKEAVRLTNQDRTLEKWESQAAAMQKVNSQYETMNGLLDSQLSLMKLMSGEDAYADMANNLSAQVDTSKAIMDLNNQQMAYWAEQMAANTEDSVLWKQAKENYEDATSAYYSSMSTYIEKLKEEEINSINAVFAEREKLSKQGVDLDYASEEWDLINEFDDKYFDQVNRAYREQELARKYQTALNNTSDVNLQAKIRNLMDEQLEILDSQDQLSEYDLERAEKKLEVLEKENALLDARNAKTQMQLVRGADGSYSYEYIANMENVIKAEDELAKAQNELYNLDLEEYKSTLNDALSYYQDFKDKWLETASIANEEERDARREMLKEQYLGEDGLITELVGGDGLARVRENLTEIMSDLGYEFSDERFGALNEFVDNLSTLSADQFTSLTEPLEQINSAFVEANNALKGWEATLTNSLTIATDIAQTLAEATFSEEVLKNWDPELLTGAVVTKIKEGLTGTKLIYREGVDNEPGSYEWVAAGKTGLYTGEWGGDGKFLLAHEKELLLNQTDTENILNAVSFIRSLNSHMLERIAAIETSSQNMVKAPENDQTQTIEQKVEITANFPNVNVKGEIEEAFDDIINLATQHAFKKK